eukprot:4751987-Pyramimonas_sp.AAC.1
MVRDSDAEVQPPLLVRHTRATSAFVPGAVESDALTQHLTLRQRGTQVGRARQGGSQAAHGVPP